MSKIDLLPGGRLSRIVPLEIINPDMPKDWQRSLLEEMEQAWEKDWAILDQ